MDLPKDINIVKSNTKALGDEFEKDPGLLSEVRDRFDNKYHKDLEKYNISPDIESCIQHPLVSYNY